MTDITARIAEGRRLLAQVSPAPWRHEWNHDECHDCGVDVRDKYGLRVALCEFDEDTCLDDAALIARMRNEYAALLDVVEAAQKRAAEAVPQWAPELRAALAAYARAGGAK